MGLLESIAATATPTSRPYAPSGADPFNVRFDEMLSPTEGRLGDRGSSSWAPTTISA